MAIPQPQCWHCRIPMKVLYRREGKKWIRMAWGCIRCGMVEQGMRHDFRPHRKSRM